MLDEAGTEVLIAIAEAEGELGLADNPGLRDEVLRLASDGLVLLDDESDPKLAQLSVAGLAAFEARVDAEEKKLMAVSELLQRAVKLQEDEGGAACLRVLEDAQPASIRSHPWIAAYRMWARCMILLETGGPESELHDQLSELAALEPDDVVDRLRNGAEAFKWYFETECPRLSEIPSGRRAQLEGVGLLPMVRSLESVRSAFEKQDEAWLALLAGDFSRFQAKVASAEQDIARAEIENRPGAGHLRAQWIARRATQHLVETTAYLAEWNPVGARAATGKMQAQSASLDLSQLPPGLRPRWAEPWCELLNRTAACLADLSDELERHTQGRAQAKALKSIIERMENLRSEAVQIVAPDYALGMPREAMLKVLDRLTRTIRNVLSVVEPQESVIQRNGLITLGAFVLLVVVVVWAGGTLASLPALIVLAFLSLVTGYGAKATGMLSGLTRALKSVTGKEKKKLPAGDDGPPDDAAGGPQG